MQKMRPEWAMEAELEGGVTDAPEKGGRPRLLYGEEKSNVGTSQPNQTAAATNDISIVFEKIEISGTMGSCAESSQRYYLEEPVRSGDSLLESQLVLIEPQ